MRSDDISVVVISSLNEARRGGFVDQRPAIGVLVLNMDLEHRRSYVIDPSAAETFLQPSVLRSLQVHLPRVALHPSFAAGWMMDARLNALGSACGP